MATIFPTLKIGMKALIAIESMAHLIITLLLAFGSDPKSSTNVLLMLNPQLVTHEIDGTILERCRCNWKCHGLFRKISMIVISTRSTETSLQTYLQHSTPTALFLENATQGAK